MRFMPIEKLQPGMRLGKNIYNAAGNLVLSKDKIFTEGIIELFQKQGYLGVYIEDEISVGIIIEEIVSIETRYKAQDTIRKFFLTEPWNVSLVYTSVKDSVEEIMLSILDNKNVVMNMVDLKTYDDYTYGHSVNVAILSGMIGAGLDLQPDVIKNLITAAILHDIGKKFISLSLLNKRGELTAEEYEIMKRHSSKGYEYIKERLCFSAHICNGILQHHERYDGTGYPLGRAGKDISLIARIIGVADTYDALTSNRPYHKAYSAKESIEFIMGNSGRAFDPDVVRILVAKVARYPVGTEVTLSTGQKALVVKNYIGFTSRPLLKILPSGELVDLKDNMKSMNIIITD